MRFRFFSGSTRQHSKTFRWKGTYGDNMDDRRTDRLELNVLAEAPPTVPAEYKDSKFVFLANTTPALQNQLLEQIASPAFVAADTMNCWIEGQLGDLKLLLKKIDCLIINEEEARLLAGEFNLIEAGEKVLNMGPSVVIIKKGESGSIMCSAGGERFILPAYPATEVKDPTGAGDGFAGGVMGYLAQCDKTGFESLKTAIGYGTVIASFTIADFSLQGLAAAKKNDIESRFETLKKLTSF